MDSSSVTATMVASDPVSLRAAALSTRKSKRRKPPLEQSVTLSLRPPPSNDSFQLDYGQEDPTDTVSKPTIMPSAPDVVVKREKTPVVLQDVQLREEGEISDEEGPPPPSISSKDHIRKPPEPPVFAVHEPKVEEPTPTISVAPVSLPKSSSPQIPQTLPLMDRISDPVADMPTHLLQLDQDQDQDMDVPVLDLLEEPPNYVLGPDCVRPGVELSQDEYDTAKDIILDLLGWGVPFDHLVQSGVSKRLIFYVFNELNLCLPDTFDSSGIAPYPPEVFPELDQSVAIGPPLPEGRAMSTDSDEPVGMDAISNSVPPPIETTPSVDVPTEADLHDMERLRRQELMARKAAAQASRKQKQSASLESLIQPAIPTDSMVVDQDTEAPPYAATETVEDFLNSLGTVQGLDTSPTSVFSPTVPESRTYSPDQPINNDVVDMDDHGEEGPLNTVVSESFSISSRQSQTFGPPPPSSSSEAPPSSVASTTSTFSQVSLSGPETTQRRGVKRPVASDFVDFDPLPKRHETSRMDRFNGTGGITRRLNSRMSFQNINSRRCVIDLSDSEDEDDEQQPHRMNDEPSQQWPDKRAHLIRFPPSAPVKSTSSGTISPAILEQKELEIRQMRELIAKREEETRLRKLALANSASVNSGQHGASTSVVQHKHVKVKEADSGIVSTETDDMDAQVPESSVQSESGTPHSATAESREYSFTPEVPGIPSDIQEPQADSHISNDEGRGLQEQVIDVDLNASLSAQMNTEPMPSAFPGQDIQNQEDSQPLDHDHLQVQDNDQDTFSSYRSPFDLYPLLRSHGQPVASSSDMYSSRPLLSSHLNFVDTKTLGSSTFSSSSLLLDLKPLRLAALAKSLDPFKRLCQFEVPGGGTCRDEGCEDIHLSRLVDANQTVALEPNDEDTANYLFDNLPPSWLDGHHIASPSKILAALQDINRKNLNNPSRLEDRVSQALHSLGSAPTT